MFAYKIKYTFEARLTESRKIRDSFPGRVPIIIEKATRTTDEIPTIDKNKFLVPIDLNVGQFMFVVRKRLCLPPEKALFLCINDSLPPSTMSMRELYNLHAEPDGFLYARYCGENTFGT